MSPTDTNLIERWTTRGDANAFQVLVERHSAMVYRTCLRLLGNREDAEDATQDCFVRLAQGAAKPGSPVGAWLHRVATNRCLDVLRSRKRRAIRDERAGLESAQTAEPTRWDDLQQHVDAALAELPGELREVLVARFLEGRNQREIGLELGITRQAVAQRIERGIVCLRQRLGNRGVTLGVPALAGALAGLTANATPIPAALMTSLGHLTLAGPAHVALAFAPTGVSAWIAGGIVMKKFVAACAVLVLLGLAAYWYTTAQDPVRLDVAPDTGIAQEGAVLDVDPDSAERAAGVVSDAPTTPETTGGPTTVPEVPEPTTEPEYAFVSGHVRDEAGVPVQGAAMQLLVMDSALREENMVLLLDNLLGTAGRVLGARTDHTGYYEFSAIAQFGQGIVSAQVAGYIAMDDASGVPRVLELGPGSRVEGANFLLRRGEPVQGRVLSPDRRPVAGAQVMWLKEAMTTTSDSAGEFMVDVIDPDVPLDFAVRAAGYPTVTFENLSPGADGFVELLLHGYASLAGTILEADGAPSPGREVVAEPVDYAGPAASAITAGDGSYAIGNLASVAYRVSVRSAEGDALSRPEALAPLRGGETRVWDHTIVAPATVEGTVYLAGTREPFAGAYVAWVEEGKVLAGGAADAEGRYTIALYDAKSPVTLQPLHAPVGEGPIDIGVLGRYARTIGANPNAKARADLELPGASMMFVRFVDPDGNPVTAGEVECTTWIAAEPTRADGFKNSTVKPANVEGWYGIPCPQGRACTVVLRAGDSHPWLQAQSGSFEPDGPGDSYEEEVSVYYVSYTNGKIFDPEGRGLHFRQIGFRVTDEQDEEQFVFPETDKDGDFSVNLRAMYGTRLELYGQGTEGWTWSLDGPVDFPAGEHVELGEIRLRAVE